MVKRKDHDNMDMLELAIKIHDQVVNFWQFFVPSAVALLGWVFSRRQPWPLAQRIAVAVAFMGFAIFNLYGLIQSYETLDTLVTELSALNGETKLTPTAFHAMINRLSMGWGWKIGIVFHLVVDVIVLYFILVWARRSSDSQPEASKVHATGV
jgi:hypothetical protein